MYQTGAKRLILAFFGWRMHHITGMRCIEVLSKRRLLSGMGAFAEHIFASTLSLFSPFSRHEQNYVRETLWGCLHNLTKEWRVPTVVFFLLSRYDRGARTPKRY